MKYKLWDILNNKYYGKGFIFKSLKNIKKFLLDEHDNEFHTDELKDYKKFKKLHLQELCEIFNWEIHNAKTEKIVLI